MPSTADRSFGCRMECRSRIVAKVMPPNIAAALHFSLRMYSIHEKKASDGLLFVGDGIYLWIAIAFHYNGSHERRERMPHASTLAKPERRGAGWWVPSATCPTFGYTVFKDAQGWHCQCPSHRWRRQTQCRHVQEVLKLLRKEVTMG